jgi:formylglycine-generating enzyme required for sulfatase activity
VLAQRLSRPRFPVPPGRLHALLMSQDETAAAKSFVGLMCRAAVQVRKTRRIGDEGARAPALVLAIDQAEELFEPEDAAESERFLRLLAHLLRNPPQGVEPFVIVTIRAESVDRLLQALARLELEAPEALMLPALPPTSYREIILKPIEVLARRGQRLTIEPDLTEQLVNDTSGADALPLLAFTLAQLYRDFSAAGSITLKDYEAMGGVGGAISKAMAAARARPGDAPSIPAGEEAQLAMLRAAFIPALARIDPQSGGAMRRVARLDEIPETGRAMVQRLVRSRLLVADRRAGVDVVEVAHESLLRQWPPLKAWLEAEAESLKLIEDIERSASQWNSHGRQDTWLDHRGTRLAAAQTIARRPDFQKRLGELAANYLAACQLAQRAAQRRNYGMQAAVAALVLSLGVGVAAWWQQHWFKERAYWLLHVRGQVLTAEQERAREPQDPPFKECTDCPDMMVLPAGRFLMGAAEGMGAKTEQPQHPVTLGSRLAVGRFEITFDQWDACARWGDCNPRIPSGDWGRGAQPAINVTFEDAQRYVAWLSRMTGRRYRLLTEAEWEYAARANTQTHFFFGNDETPLGDYAWFAANSEQQTHPVGTRKPNPLGLYDMYGNVSEWVEDCAHDGYRGAPSDGSAWTSGNCTRRVVRGGSWIDRASSLRSSNRDWFNFDQGRDGLGLRVARELQR